MFNNIGTVLIVLFLVVWSFIWKGIALWKSAKNGHLPWFIAILLLNTFGLIEILYLSLFQKNKPVNIQQETAPPKE